jgi:WD40 repeat protein
MSLPDWGTVCSGEVGPGSWGFLSETSIITATRDPNDRRARTLVSFPIDGGSPKTLGTVWSFRAFDLDPERGRLVFARGKSLILSDLQDLQGGSERVLGSHGEDIDFALIARATGDRVVTSDESGTIHVWSAAGALERTFTFPGEWRAVTLGRWGRRFALSTALGPVYVWDLEGPPGALPSRFTPRPDVEPAGDVVLDPEGRWAVVMRQPAMGFWPLAWPRYRVIRNEWEPPFSAVFTPDGTRLVLRGMRQLVVVPLAPGTESPSAIQAGGSGFYAEVHPSGRSLATLVSHSVVTVPLDGCELGDPLEVVPSSGARRATAAFDPTGRLLATATVQVVDSPEPILLQVLDLETGARTDLPVAPAVDGDTTDDLDLGVVNLRFAADGTLYTAGPSGVRRWNLAAGTSELLHPCDRWCWIFLDDDGRVGLVATHDQPWESASELFTIDLESRATSTITSHGDRFRPFAVALDPDGRAIITGGPDGVVRVGPIDGGEPHLLLGHPDPVTAVAVSPDGRWIASVSGSEIRLWAMPDVSRPPLHTLPRAELLAKLDSITNVRAVRDPESATGWKVEVGPFPGWAEVPTW